MFPVFSVSRRCYLHAVGEVYLSFGSPTGTTCFLQYGALVTGFLAGDSDPYDSVLGTLTFVT